MPHGGLTDEKSALIEMNHTMAKVTAEMGRIAVGNGVARRQEKDFTEQLAHMHWFFGAILDSFPFPDRYLHRRRSGTPPFDAIEHSILRGGSGGVSPSAGGGGSGGSPGGGGRPDSGRGMFSWMGQIFQRRPKLELPSAPLPPRLPIPAGDVSQAQPSRTDMGLPSRLAQKHLEPLQQTSRRDSRFNPAKLRLDTSKSSPAVSQATPSRTDDEFATPTTPAQWRRYYEQFRQPRQSVPPLAPTVPSPPLRLHERLLLRLEKLADKGNRFFELGSRLLDRSAPHPLSRLQTLVHRSRHTLSQAAQKTRLRVTPPLNRAGHVIATGYRRVHDIFEGAKDFLRRPEHDAAERIFNFLKPAFQPIVRAASASGKFAFQLGKRSIHSLGRFAGKSLSSLGSGIDRASQGFDALLAWPTHKPYRQAEQIGSALGYLFKHTTAFFIGLASHNLPPLFSLLTKGVRGFFHGIGRGFKASATAFRATKDFGRGLLSSTGESIRSLFVSEPAVLSSLPRRRTGGSGQRPTMPPSMRPRKYSGMGAYTDFFPHVGAEFSTGYFMQAFLKHGTPDMLPHAAKLHAHLQGGREMQKKEFHELYHQAREVRDEKGRRVFSNDFLKKLVTAARMAKDKHEQAESHQAGLRMRGKLGSTSSDNSLGQMRQHQQARRSAKRWERLKDVAAHYGEHGRHIAKAGLMYGGVALQNASPDAFATLTGSFQLLAAQLGTSLVPLAAKASMYLQDAAKGFENLSDSTKQWIGITATATTGLAGLVALSPQILAFAGLLKSLAKGSLFGGKLLGGLALAHPFAAASIGIGVGLTLYDHAQKQDLIQHYQENHQRIKDESQQISIEKIKQFPEYKEVENLNLRTSTGRIQEQIEAAKSDIYREAQNIDYLTGRRTSSKLPKDMNWFERQAATIRGSYNIWHDEGAIKVHQDARLHAEERLERLNNIQDLLIYGDKGFQNKRLKNSPELKKQRDSALVAANGLLVNLQSRTQPAYYGLEDMYKKIQLEALGENPLQAELRRIQLAQLAALLEIAGYSKEQVKRDFGIILP